MNNRNKLKVIEEANQRLEQSYLKSKGLLKEEEEYTEGPHNYFPNDPKDVTKSDIKTLFTQIQNFEDANKFIQKTYGPEYKLVITGDRKPAGYAMDFEGPDGKIIGVYPVDINGSVTAQKKDDNYRSSENKDAQQFGYKKPF